MKSLRKYHRGHEKGPSYSIESFESLGALSSGKSATTSDRDHAWGTMEWYCERGERLLYRWTESSDAQHSAVSVRCQYVRENLRHNTTLILLPVI